MRGNLHRLLAVQAVEDDPPVRTHWYLTRLERQQIAAHLLEEVTMATGQPILSYGAVGRCAKKFGALHHAISRVCQTLVVGLHWRMHSSCDTLAQFFFGRQIEWHARYMKNLF